MSRWVGKIRRRFRSASGQTLFEYAIIIALVALVAVVVLRGIGDYPPKAMEPVNDALD